MLTATLRLGQCVYKRVVAPALHAFGSLFGVVTHCRYQPTCSEYAVLAVAEHGLRRGGCLAVWRLLRCNPLARGGWDPVPAARQGKPHPATNS